MVQEFQIGGTRAISGKVLSGCIRNALESELTRILIAKTDVRRIRAKNKVSE
jgi:hypothetical protein